MLTYTLKEIAAITHGETFGDSTLEVCHIATDSRKIAEAQQTLFIAIDGERHDGHNYLGEMYQKGVRCFLINKRDYANQPAEGSGYILVKDTIAAFQSLAAHHRSLFKVPIVAITGSNGKTIVKEWLSACLAQKILVTRSPKSYNSQLGVPLSVWLLNNNSQMGIFEAGISKCGEMQHLEAILHPDHGLFTNIGEAHQENFKSVEEKINEKLKLFINCKHVYYCADNPIISDGFKKALFNNQPVFHSWSATDSSADMLVKVVQTRAAGTTIDLQYKGACASIDIQFSDKASVENSLHVINFLLANNFSFEEISRAMQQLQPVAMRLELVKGMNHCTLINDAYNSDLNSLGIALDYLLQQPQGKKHLILSDIQQSGIPEKELYSEVARLVHQAKISRFTGIGPALLKSAEEFSFVKSSFFETTQQFLETDRPGNFTNEAILIKGARKFQFERLVTALAEKNHTTLLEINLNNLLSNLNYFRSLLSPGTGIMVMVKALAYGSGSHEIATLLQHEKVDYLGVAFTDEGIQLRQAGINLPIMVMSPGREDFARIIENDLEPEIYSFATLKSFIETATLLQASAYPIHLKADTGMHRLGFMEAEIDEAIGLLKNTNSVQVKAVFSHLAASDDARHDEFTGHQLASFARIYTKICGGLNIKPKRHILNSAGIERFPSAHFEMVRLGIGLHGISSAGKNLLPVSTLKTHISQIKTIPAGETIGYNRRGNTEKDTRIAIIPIGYADGLNRRFGNGNGHVITHNSEAPFIGDICMDMCMVNISGINCAEGDQVIVFGEQNPVTRLAKQIGTIPYEILTNVSTRVKRIYYKD
ncbi:MAG: bifunctional UDP-N-acetylmuramoyl-tripeptide:D-alanyl-D-alanine ligase/alanine racemase [Bacteroidales bacterium]|nr:bifunctional UDP-N-acetylmuramoyl-tripeptide:D-alanyl-D-alanine ligase/alanine racemase [Bacteroidales bacterium]